MDIIKDFISTPVIGMNFDTIAEDAAKEMENKTYCSDGRDQCTGKIDSKDMIT